MAVNKVWMINTAATLLRALLQLQRASPPPLSKLPRASLESILCDERSAIKGPVKKVRPFKARRGRKHIQKPRKKHPLPTRRSACRGCSSLAVWRLFRAIVNLSHSYLKYSMPTQTCPSEPPTDLL